MANEHKVQDRVISILNENPRCITLRVTNITGVSDIVACVGGRFVSIEVKDDKEGSYGITKGQRIRLRKVYRCGGVACIVDKNNIEDFEKLIERMTEGDGFEGVGFGLEGEGVI